MELLNKIKRFVSSFKRSKIDYFFIISLGLWFATLLIIYAKMDNIQDYFYKEKSPNPSKLDSYLSLDK